MGFFMNKCTSSFLSAIISVSAQRCPACLEQYSLSSGYKQLVKTPAHICAVSHTLEAKEEVRERFFRNAL